MLYFPRLFFIRWLVDKLEYWCTFLHHDPIIWLEIKLTGRYCNLTNWSYDLDQKYNIGVWRELNSNNPLDQKRIASFRKEI